MKQAPEMQSSTAELITGLVQLVPLSNSTQLSQEAMEVSTNTHRLLWLLICIHHVIWNECCSRSTRCKYTYLFI